MKSIVVSALLLMVGCALDDSGVADPEPQLATETQSLVPAAPSTPSTPAPLRQYLATHPQLYPVGVKSAFTVIWPDPADSFYFLAVGYDVVAYRNVFFVRGTFGKDHSLVLTNIADGMVLNTKSNPLFKDYGSRTAVRKPPPSPPTPFPQGVWAIAYNMLKLQP